jgi:GNAT superfamily N-acetyltransferase
MELSVDEQTLLSDLIIRQALPGDLAAILALNAELHPGDQPLPSDEEVAQVWRHLIENPIMHPFVAEYAAQVVATCVLAILPNLTRGARPFGLIENVVTTSALRGRGIGRTLLQATLTFAWQRSCYKVMLLTGRPTAVSFYEQVGFRQDAKIGLIAKPPKDADFASRRSSLPEGRT